MESVAMKSTIRLVVASLEAKEVPSGGVGDNPGTDSGSVPAMSPQEPTVIEPDFQIILPPR